MVKYGIHFRLKDKIIGMKPQAFLPIHTRFEHTLNVYHLTLFIKYSRGGSRVFLRNIKAGNHTHFIETSYTMVYMRVSIAIITYLSQEIEHFLINHHNKYALVLF